MFHDDDIHRGNGTGGPRLEDIQRENVTVAQQAAVFGGELFSELYQSDKLDFFRVCVSWWSYRWCWC